MCYTSKDMRAKLASANQTLEGIGHPYRLLVNSSNDSNFLTRCTPGQATSHSGSEDIFGACGTPQMISHFIKVYMLGAYDQWQAGRLLEQRASDLMIAQARAWDMGYSVDDLKGLDLQGVQSLIRHRAQEQREQQRAKDLHDARGRA